eukprot:5461107-Alexandrium_andersonii.AAC.1
MAVSKLDSIQDARHTSLRPTNSRKTQKNVIQPLAVRQEEHHRACTRRRHGSRQQNHQSA